MGLLNVIGGGLTSMGTGVAAFSTQAGLEQQKASLAQQGMVLADQLAHASKTAEISQTGSIAATAAEAQHGYALSEQAPRLATEVQTANISAGATLGAANIAATASKYASDATTTNVIKELDAAAPQRAEALLTQRQQTISARLQNDNASALTDTHAQLAAEAAKPNPDPGVITTLTNKVMALETSASTVAASNTAKAAIYRTDVDNLQQLNTRKVAAVAAMNTPDISDSDKVAAKALIADLDTQIRGAQRAVDFSSQQAHGVAFSGAPPPPPPSDRPTLGAILTPPGGNPAPAASGKTPTPTPAASTAPEHVASGPSNSPPALLEPLSPGGRSFARDQLFVMNQVDAGQKVAASADPLGYAQATPAQRAAIRAGILRTITDADAASSNPGLLHNGR